MNASAKDRECLTKKNLCEHELSLKGWFRDVLSFPPGMIFRPHSAGPANPRRSGESDLSKATTREAQASKVNGRLSLSFCKIPLRAASPLLVARARISFNFQIATTRGLRLRNQNQTERPNI
jgi:hypothetical protein